MRLEFLVLFFVFFTLVSIPVARGQNHDMQASPVVTSSPHVLTEYRTLANDLELIHVRSEAFTASTLVARWSFKPALELELAGKGHGLARCISEKLSLDSVAWEEAATWQIHPDGAVIQGPMDSTLSGWNQDFLDAIMHPPLEAIWPAVQEHWLEKWDAENTPVMPAIARVKSHLLFGPQHPYGELHFPRTIEAISASEIRAYHTDYWHPNNSQFYWFTPMEVEDIPSSWVTQLESWKSREVQPSAVTAPGRPRSIKSAIIDRNSDSVGVCLAHILRMKPDHPDATALDMIRHLLSQSTTTEVEIDADPLMGSFSIAWNSTPSVAAREVRGVLNAMRERVNGSLSEGAMDSLRASYLLSQTALNLDWPKQSVHDMAPQDVTWVQNVNDLDSIVQTIQASDLQRVAINYLRPKNLHLILDGNRSDLEAVAREFSPEDELLFFNPQGRQMSNYGPVPAGLLAADVIDSFYEACGGVASFESLRSAIREGTMVAGGAMQMNVKISETYGVGNRTSYSIEGQAMMEYILRPGQGISIQMGQQRPMNSSEYRRYEQGLYAGYLLHLEDLGLACEVVGTAQRNGAELLVLELRRNGKLEQTLFFDTQTHLLMSTTEERTGPTGPIILTIEYEDYRTFGGLTFPTQIARRSNNQRMDFTIESIDLNPRIDQSIYSWE